MARMPVIQAVEGHLAANWSLCPVVGVLTPDNRAESGNPFLIVQYPVANGRQASFGAPSENVQRETGAFRILIHIERGRLEQGILWADDLAALFRGQQLGGLYCYEPSSPAVDDRNDRGNWDQLSMAFPYHHDLIA